LREVRDAIRVQLETGPSLRLDDVAARIYISASTLQRALTREGTTFTELRRQVRVEVAIERLTAGFTCISTAAYIGLSRDHMCKLVRDYTGLTPRRIIRARKLAQRARGWRNSPPPATESWFYAERRRRWRTLETELGRLVAEVPADSPLADWADRLLRSSRRPDYRSVRYRKLVAAERRREQAAFFRSLQRAVAGKPISRPTQTTGTGGNHV
jgi:AraC-like DNA-binding protein